MIDDKETVREAALEISIKYFEALLKKKDMQFLLEDENELIELVLNRINDIDT